MSYMFVHESYEHLYSNLWSLGLASARCWSRLGPATFYSCFFSGGVVAALNSSSKNLQLERQLAPWLTSPLRALQGIPVVSPSLHGWAEHASSSAARFISPHIKFVGCSAGVSSLCGVNFILTAEDIYELLRTRSSDPGAWSVSSLLCYFQNFLSCHSLFQRCSHTLLHRLLAIWNGGQLVLMVTPLSAVQKAAQLRDHWGFFLFYSRCTQMLLNF